MRIKKNVAFFLILILTFSLASAPRAKSPSDVALSISPSSIIDVPKSLSTITINVTFTYVDGLNNWDIKIRYNPVLLQTNSSLIALDPLFAGFPPYFHSEQDYLEIGWLDTSGGLVFGEGTLVTITFVVKGSGETNLDLYYAKLADASTPEIVFPSTSQDGYFRNVDATLIPRADFVYYADSYNVTFNASSSFSSETSIQRYFWIWDDPNAKQSNTTQPVILHTYLEKFPPQNETAAVRLFVTDSLNVTSNILLRIITFGVAVHDVAVTSIESSPKSVLVGNFSSATISVSLTNLGNHLENTSISVSYNSTSFDFNVSATQWTLLQIQDVKDLASSENRTLAFSWNTTGLSPGFYALKAEASLVSGESNTTNNVLARSRLLRIVTVLFAPVASFVFDPVYPKVGENILFDASQSYDRDGRIVEYVWNFGDSYQNVTLQPAISHVYQKAGVFNVTLTVTDDDGFSAYVVFLVTVSKVASAVAISLPTTTAIVNSTFTFWGQVLSVESPVNVTIFYRVYGQFVWNVLGNATTDSAGLFSYGWMPSEPGAYQFKATWEGDNKFLEASSDVALTTAKFRSEITLSLSKDSATVGDSLAINGHLTHGLHGVVVTIMIKQDNYWRLLSEISTDENGSFSLPWKPSTVGTYMFKAEWSGDNQSLGAQSPVASVTIEPRSEPVSYLPYVAIAVTVLFVAFLLGFWKIRRSSK